MTREEAMIQTMKEKDTPLLRMLATSPEGIVRRDIRDAAKRELESRGEAI